MNWATRLDPNLSATQFRRSGFRRPTVTWRLSVAVRATTFVNCRNVAPQGENTVARSPIPLADERRHASGRVDGVQIAGESIQRFTRSIP